MTKGRPFVKKSVHYIIHMDKKIFKLFHAGNDIFFGPVSDTMLHMAAKMQRPKIGRCIIYGIDYLLISSM